VRDALSLHTGDKLEFVVRQGGDALIRPVTRNVDDVFGKQYKAGRKPVSVEEMGTAIKQRARTTFK